MNALVQLKRAQQAGLFVAQGLSWLPPLLARLTLGAVFVQSGWGKLHHLSKVAGYFASLGLPAPEFQARLVSATELVGGGLVLVGLAARLAACPLAITMVVAIATAKAAEVKHLTDLSGLTEFTYLVLLLYVAVAGPGAVSFDALLFRKQVARDASTLPSDLRHKLGLGATALASVVLLGFLGWWFTVSHNPCDRIGPGVHPELVTQSRAETDEGDAAQATCRHILQWQKTGKNVDQELQRERDEADER